MGKQKCNAFILVHQAIIESIIQVTSILLFQASQMRTFAALTCLNITAFYISVFSITCQMEEDLSLL